VELSRPSGGKTEAQLLLPTAPVKLQLGKPCRLELAVSGTNIASRSFTCEIEWKAEFDPMGFPDEAVDVSIRAKAKPSS